ncbi:Uncharacterised protein [Mycobacteroides abscessus subsp. abscessus]|nr:Uncharacterised protein [Mycobacteroides abscessus subsp. abscessus]
MHVTDTDKGHTVDQRFVLRRMQRTQVLAEGVEIVEGRAGRRLYESDEVGVAARVGCRR